MSLEGLFGGGSGGSANPLSLLTSGISAISGIAGGFQKSSAASYNAATAQTQARIAEQEAATEAQQEQQTWRQRIGAAITNAGASGVDPNEGSPVNVVAAMGQQGELARQLALYRGTLQATGFRRQASLDTYQGDQALYASIATGGTTFLTGLSGYLQRKTPSGNSAGVPGTIST